MTNIAESKLHEFERQLFIKSRSIKSTGAVAAVATLLATLHDLEPEVIAASDAKVSQIYHTIENHLTQVAHAAEVGSQELAVEVYANILRAVPSIHIELAEYAPAIRGGGTPPEQLINASQRALSILGVA